MKKVLPILLLTSLWLVVCAGKKPAAEGNPYPPLLKYLPDDSSLVMLVDLAELGKVYRDFWDWMEKLPIVKGSTDLQQVVRDAKRKAATFLLWVKNRCGLDPLYDLKNAAVGFVIGGNEEIGIVVAMSGKFPTDILRRLLPGAESSKQGKTEVVSTALGIKVMFTENKILVLTWQADLQQVLQPRKPDRRLFKRHPGILSGVGPELLLRQSYSQPELGTEALRRLQGVKHAELEIGREVSWRVEVSTGRQADDIEYMLKALSEMSSGLPHLARSIAYWAIGTNISELKEIPQPLRSALNDRQAVIDTLKVLFPEEVESPKISRKGVMITATASRPVLVRYLMVMGAGMAAGASFYSYLADKEAEVRSGWKLLAVVVANQDMPKGTAVQYDNVAKMQMPEQFISPSMIRPVKFEQAIGKKLKFDLKRGDILYWYLLGE
jgi:hypothetical protein